jgi:uncharacterized protein (DUF983 family)
MKKTCSPMARSFLLLMLGSFMMGMSAMSSIFYNHIVWFLMMVVGELFFISMMCYMSDISCNRSQVKS